jgi:hypothetical protein
MEQVAYSYLERGDTAAAASVFSTLETGRPKYARMARLTRVVADPSSVPLPHRHADIAEAILEERIPLRAFAGCAVTSEQLQKVFQKLLLAVHPDKNPHPKAAEAFIRLQSRKEEFTAIAEVVVAEKMQQQREAEQYTRLASTPPPQAPTPAPARAPTQPIRKKPAVPKKKQLESVLSTLKARGSQKLKLSCNLSLSAFDEHRRQLSQNLDDAEEAGEEDEEAETLLCTVSSVSIRSMDGSQSTVLLSPTSAVERNSGGDAQQSKHTLTEPALHSFTFKGLQPVVRPSQTEKDRAAAEVVLGHVLGKLPAQIPASTKPPESSGKAPLGSTGLSFRDMLHGSGGSSEIRLMSLRGQS